ncbi:MAG: pentapeptide repeat-containing protein [Acetobacteraceae bacterium]|nr:pentapeptide repeat-containing protein [Acetobacteraceae bacterium]
MSWLSVAAHWYLNNRAIINPAATAIGAIGAFVTAVIGAHAALKNARSATRQAETASLRHKEQTEADRQRHMTESFSTAMEQLGSEKLELGLGGIYTLEQISQERGQENYYWPIMETLTAFVREHARWAEPPPCASETEESDEQPRRSPGTDVVAILTVVKRRKPEGRRREKENKWCLNLSGTDLRGADIAGIHLEGAFLVGVNWEGAHLPESFLQGAQLHNAHLEEPALWECISSERFSVMRAYKELGSAGRISTSTRDSRMHVLTLLIWLAPISGGFFS